MYLQIDLAWIQKIFIYKNQRFASKDDILKAILKYWNRTQKVLERDTSNISSRNIYAHYHKLPDKSESNRKKTIELNALHIVSDLAKFSSGRFQRHNSNKRY